jgi:hypothetical protein
VPSGRSGDEGGEASELEEEARALRAAQEEGVVEASKAALSNLLGSMGYFYGSSQVLV